MTIKEDKRIQALAAKDYRELPRYELVKQLKDFAKLYIRETRALILEAARRLEHE